MAASNTLIGLIVAVACTVLYFILGNKKKPRLPPGPKGLPLLGNLSDLPEPGEREYEVWTKHKELYGPISSLRIFGQTIIVINSADLAMELLEKRATVSYSRPSMVFAGEMCGWNKIMMFQGPRRLRAYRRHFHNIIGSQSSLVKFMPVLETEVKRFLVRVLGNPNDLLQHVRTEAGAIILKLTYDYDIEPHKQDPLIKLAEDAMDQFSHAATPGAWIVDLIPAFKYLPDWMPGSGFKRTARLWQKTFLKLGNVPMRFVQRQMKAEHCEPSFVSSVYEKAGGRMTTEEEDIATWSAASMYAGGADTSVSSMQLFFLAMSVHTEIQRKAQAEIDHVIGSDRLPTLADRANLPYVSALVSEVLRWHVIAPLGLPHVTTTETVISGYRIPEDSTIIPNIWLFAHDPETYKQPMDFRPERFIGDSPERDPRDFVFGFGRRVCPGRALADSSVWLTVAMSLAALVIEKGVDAKGNVIEPEVKFTPGVISHPVPFKTSIQARSQRYAELVKEVEKTHPWVEGMSEKLEGLDD